MNKTLLACCLAIPLACSPATNPGSTTASASLLDFPVPEFSWTERSGKTVTNADLKGKVWIASFVFTRCTGPCPQVTATVAKLQEHFKDSPDVRLVTFTIDPDRDTLKDLQSYAKQYQADPDRWFFLTGEEKRMHDFATKGFKLLAQKKDGGQPGDEFDHSSKLAVVDKKGIIRGTFDGMAVPERPADFETYQTRLKELVAKLVKE